MRSRRTKKTFLNIYRHLGEGAFNLKFVPVLQLVMGFYFGDLRPVTERSVSLDRLDT